MLNATRYNWTQKRIAERWGIPFWQLVSDLHAQDFNRTKAAAALGMDKNGFTLLLRNNPDENPWGSPNIIANYIRDTGESFRDALERMSREGYSLNAASRAIGFSGLSSNFGLKYAMRARGIDVKFKEIPSIRKSRKPVEKGPNVTTGWPTWGQIYAMQRPA
jgi:hypothetical protein